MKLSLSKQAWRRGLLLGTALMMLNGCQTLGMNASSLGDVPSSADISAMMARPRAIPELIAQGDAALKAGDLQRAQRLFAAALKLDVTNPDLQFLNGLTYHLIGVSSDRSKLELAEQGLKLALKFDPGHLEARYQLGLLYLDQRRYARAEGYFASVALQRPNDATLLYNLAAASYYAHDPRMAAAALKQLVRVAPKSGNDPDVVRAQAVVEAALDDNKAAQGYLDIFRRKSANTAAAEHLERRLRAWQGFYAHDARLVLAQFAQQPGVGGAASGATAAQSAQPDYPYGAAATPDYGATPDGSRKCWPPIARPKT